MMPKKTPPSLVDLCVRKAVANVRYLGDVGETDMHLLERILPHCTLEQLRHVENSTKGRDLSPVTDKLWKKFFELQFTVGSSNLVVERMRQNKVSFKWKELYEAKLKANEEAEKKAGSRLKKSYEEQLIRKQSRQVQTCNKVPPSSNKRGWWSGPGYNLSGSKSNIMKKAKIELIKSQEVKNLTALRRNAVQRDYRPSAPAKLNVVRKNSALTSKPSSSFNTSKPSSSFNASKPSSSFNRRY